MEKIKEGILYLSLHNLLRKKFGINTTITKKELFCELGKHFLVPKPLRSIVIIEMEKRKLLKEVDRRNVEILVCEIDLEKDQNKFYEQMGLF